MAKWMKNELIKIVHFLLTLYWRVVKPTTVGVRIMLIKKEKILLVKHSYQDHWYLPGGGVKKNETIFNAVHREIKEELGGKINAISLFNVYSHKCEGKNDHVILFTSEDFEFELQSKSIEIEEVKMFPINELPDNISPGSRRRIVELTNVKNAAGTKW